eukprot:1157570-Pelagomonas_calceolata.AAC.1
MDHARLLMIHESRTHTARLQARHPWKCLLTNICTTLQCATETALTGNCKCVISHTNRRTAYLHHHRLIQQSLTFQIAVQGQAPRQVCKSFFTLKQVQPQPLVPPLPPLFPPHKAHGRTNAHTHIHTHLDELVMRDFTVAVQIKVLKCSLQPGTPHSRWCRPHPHQPPASFGKGPGQITSQVTASKGKNSNSSNKGSNYNNKARAARVRAATKARTATARQGQSISKGKGCDGCKC